MIAGDRMKNREAQSFPFAEQAWAILATRRPAKAGPMLWYSRHARARLRRLDTGCSIASARRSGKPTRGATTVSAFTTFAGRLQRISRSGSMKICST